MLVVARLRPPGDSDSFVVEVQAAIDALAARPGHVSTRLARAYDDPGMWVLVSEWENVGSYRRALGAYDVKMASAVLMGSAVNEPSAYDVVASAAVEPG